MARQGASSAGVLAATTIIVFISLMMTWDATGVMGDTNLCNNGQISDDGTHASYVAHVLAELAAVVPTSADHQDGTIFPGNGVGGSILGLASCAASTDARSCSDCLVDLQQLLFDSCQNWIGGVAVDGDSVCTMGFKTVA